MNDAAGRDTTPDAAQDTPQDVITAPELAGLDGIGHGFFTRNGGVSEGIYASLNCGFGSDDAPDRVA